MEAIILIGIQASGKSSFYQQRFFHSHVRISLDLLKTRHREHRFLTLCLETQQRFVVDNTNPTPADRARYIPMARDAGFRVVGYYVESVVKDAIRRNAARPKVRQVPPAAIAGTAARLVLPTLDEGFDELYTVRMGADQTFIVEPWQAT